MDEKSPIGRFGIRAEMTRWVSDFPQPAFVQCEFVAVHGRRWVVIDKWPVVTDEDLHPQSDYPRPGVIGCEVIDRRTDATGREVLRVDIDRPWHIQSVEEETIFDVRVDQLLEWWSSAR